MSSQTSILESIPSKNESVPASIQEARTNAHKVVTTKEYPKAKNPNWRFASAKKRDLSLFKTASDISGIDSDELISKSSGVEGAVRFVFHNGTLISTPELPEQWVSNGLICGSPKAILESDCDKFTEHAINSPTNLDSAVYSNLHQSQSDDSGLFIHVPKNLVIDTPIEVVHWISGEGSSIFPKTIILADPNSKVTILERFLSVDNTNPNFSNSSLQIIASENAKVKHSLIQNLNPVSKAIHYAEHKSHKHADIKANILALGGDWFRTESIAQMLEEGSNCDILSVALTSQDQEFDQRTLQEHFAPHSTSDLLYKNALYGTSKTIFSGLIKVEEGAHFTDAYQTCRNLLLSEDAESNAMPGLEINADQVKCSHGSTSGQISDSELFYLKARGIHPETARKLILLGYTMEVLEKMEDETVVACLQKAVEKKFERLGEEG